MGQIKRFMQMIVCAPIKLYQYLISPLLPPRCRFYPSCSSYTLQAIEVYGIARGLKLGFQRLLRCHPWSKGGYDPILSNHKEKH